VAYNDQSGATSIGYGNIADFTFSGSTSPYRAGGPKALSANQVVVQTALAGDLLLSGSVGPNELALLLASYGTNGNDWAYGNIDYSTDGLVGPNDLALLLSNYGKAALPASTPAAATVSSAAVAAADLSVSAAGGILNSMAAPPKALAPAPPAAQASVENTASSHAVTTITKQSGAVDRAATLQVVATPTTMPHHHRLSPWRRIARLWREQQDAKLL
jgi:hypothetical protein